MVHCWPRVERRRKPLVAHPHEATVVHLDLIAASKSIVKGAVHTGNYQHKELYCVKKKKQLRN